jgi:hypothetical protein
MPQQRAQRDNISGYIFLGMENFAHLLHYCGVCDEQELAPLWATGLVLWKKKW